MVILVEDGESIVDRAKIPMIVHIKEVERNTEENVSIQKEIQNGVIIIMPLPSQGKLLQFFYPLFFLYLRC